MSGLTYSEITSGEFVQKSEIESPTVQWTDAILLRSLAPWQVDAIRDLSNIAGLPSDWDSYGSPSPQQDAILSTLGIILGAGQFSYFPPPSIAPVSGGGIQIEWRCGSRELDFGVLPNGQVEYLQTEDGKVIGEDTLDFVGPQVNSLLYWLISCAR
jgi:hypothetical protein